MNDKEKYYAEMESRLTKFNDTIYELSHQRYRTGMEYSQAEVDAVVGKHTKSTSDEGGNMAEGRAWEDGQTKLARFAGDIDNHFRAALAYIF